MSVVWLCRPSPLWTRSGRGWTAKICLIGDANRVSLLFLLSPELATAIDPVQLHLEEACILLQSLGGRTSAVAGYCWQGGDAEHLHHHWERLPHAADDPVAHHDVQTQVWAPPAV